MSCFKHKNISAHAHLDTIDTDASHKCQLQHFKLTLWLLWPPLCSGSPVFVFFFLLNSSYATIKLSFHYKLFFSTHTGFLTAGVVVIAFAPARRDLDWAPLPPNDTSPSISPSPLTSHRHVRGQEVSQPNPPRTSSLTPAAPEGSTVQCVHCVVQQRCLCHCVDVQ